MSDLIDRQAAINEVRWWSDQLVKTLRSGQAVNCEKTEGEVYLLDCIISGLGEIPSAQRWIPVTEQLPEDGKYVLAYSADDDFMTVEARRKFEAFQITHWMPLPEPYQEGENQ